MLVLVRAIRSHAVGSPRQHNRVALRLILGHIDGREKLFAVPHGNAIFVFGVMRFDEIQPLGGHAVLMRKTPGDKRQKSNESEMSCGSANGHFHCGSLVKKVRPRRLDAPYVFSSWVGCVKSSRTHPECNGTRLLNHSSLINFLSSNLRTGSWQAPILRWSEASRS